MDKETVITLHGCPSANIAGKCKLHGVHLTPHQIREHDCLKKQCYHFVKVDHPWWKTRDVMKQKRKARKEYLNSFGKETNT